MTGIQWEEPPEPRGGRRNWSAVARQLRSKRRQWAVVAVCADAGNAASCANGLRKGKYAGFVSGEFEAVARTVDGEARVYARYVGEPS